MVKRRKQAVCISSSKNERIHNLAKKIMFKKIGGWGTVFLLVILLIFAVDGLFKTHQRTTNSLYIVGTSEGVKKGVKGTRNLHYYFIVDGVKYWGSVPAEICRDCDDCCEIGDMVQVRYEQGNPENNDLVLSIPGE
jgi:hypothetical protein